MTFKEAAQIMKAQKEENKKDANESFEKKEEIPKKNVSFLNRYEKKSPETNTILKSLDETERLSQKFAEERKKREEEAKREAERKQKEIEEKSRKFLEMLQKEQERRENQKPF